MGRYDLDRLTRFFEALFPGEDGHVELRPFRRTGGMESRRRTFLSVRDKRRIAEEALNLGQRFETYFGVGLRSDSAAATSHGTSEHVTLLTSLWADIDAKTTGSLGSARDGFNLWPVPPSIVTFTGHGFHGYWLLDEPVSAHGERAVEFRAALKALQISILHSDDVSDFARVLRAPFTWNLKDPQRPARAGIVHLDGRRHSLDALLAKLLWEEFVPASGIGEAIVEGQQEGLAEVLATKFIEYCRANAATLPEPLWYAMITNLLPFRGGRSAIHQLSRPHPKYSYLSTERKIEHALRDAPGPHTFRFIREHGFEAAETDSEGVGSPAAHAIAQRERVKD